MPQRLVEAPQFGVYHLNLDEAGLFVAKCLWLRGVIKPKHGDPRTTAFHAPELADLLAKPAAEYAAKLLAAVSSGSLAVAAMARDMDDAIQPGSTYVEALTLFEWLSARGTDLGEPFHFDYLAQEASVAHAAADAVRAARLRQAGGAPSGPEELDSAADKLVLKHDVLRLQEEVAELRGQTPAPPLSERQGAAYLHIIGGLLGLLLGHTAAGKPYSLFESQQAVIDGLHANYGEVFGLSQRNLEDKFALAKRLLAAASDEI